MKELELKYGCNPNQTPASIYMKDGQDLPLKVLNGKPGYINFLDALNGWQLVKEIQEETGHVAATSFKHVSPTSAAIGKPLSKDLKRATFTDDVEDLDESPIACAYARARGTDRLSSFGDWISLSAPCDETCARLIKREVSDGIIAPGYTDEALEILKQKRKGSFNIVQIDPDYAPAPIEMKDVFGITFQQGHNNVKLEAALLKNVVTEKKDLPQDVKDDLLIALIALKYTQSNSVAYAFDGQTIGIGAGQQSRIHCTRLAGNKADTWFLRQCPQVLNLPFLVSVSRPVRDNVIDAYINKNEEDVTADGIWQRYFSEKPAPLTDAQKTAWLESRDDVSLASDAFFPFADNIERAFKSGVKYVVQAGGSVRDADVIAAADAHNMVMVMNGVRLFHH